MKSLPLFTDLWFWSQNLTETGSSSSEYYESRITHTRLQRTCIDILAVLPDLTCHCQSCLALMSFHLRKRMKSCIECSKMLSLRCLERQAHKQNNERREVHQLFMKRRKEFKVTSTLLSCWIEVYFERGKRVKGRNVCWKSVYDLFCHSLDAKYLSRKRKVVREE